MTAPVILVVAKAPEPGRVKTRLGADVGDQRAAALASAALLDTLDACESAFGAGRCHLALTGDLTQAVGGAVLGERLAGWRVYEQRGRGLAERLAHAHADVHQATGAPVVQVGMDTPQLTAEVLGRAAEALTGSPSVVLGPADDGGWWLLGSSSPARLRGLSSVPMSTPTTCARTRDLVLASGARLVEVPTLRDVDTAADASYVAGAAPGLRFSRLWREGESR